MTQTTPAITIYVRHSAGCKYSKDEFSKRCDCRKWLRWTQDGTRRRVKAGTRSWAEAETVKDGIRAQLAGVAAEPVAPAKGVRDAVALFTEGKRIEGISEDVLGKYTRELDRLVTYVESKGVYTVAGITRELLTGYAGTWEALYPSSQTRSVVRTRCRGFLRFCYESQWMPRVPQLPKITVNVSPTMPLTDEEYERLLEAADTFKAPPPPAKVRALIQLMRWSGLAIGDAMMLPTARLSHTDGRYRVVTARQKTGAHVSVMLPPKVGAEVAAVAGEQYIFWDGEQDIVKSWTKYVIAPLFTAAKIERGGNMMSHRLRDTFACDLLSKGIPMEDVSKLLGHGSIKTTEKHYSPWVRGRQDRLDALVEGTWEQPKKKPVRRAA